MITLMFLKLTTLTTTEIIFFKTGLHYKTSVWGCVGANDLKLRLLHLLLQPVQHETHAMLVCRYSHIHEDSYQKQVKEKMEGGRGEDGGWTGRRWRPDEGRRGEDGGRMGNGGCDFRLDSATVQQEVCQVGPHSVHAPFCEYKRLLSHFSNT